MRDDEVANQERATLWGATSILDKVPFWPAMILVSALCLLVQLAGPHATAWHFFDDAAGLIVGDGPAGQASGLHLYRDRPDLQFGPLSILVATPLSWFGPTVGSWLAMVLASAAGLLTLGLLLDAIDRLAPGFCATVPRAVLLTAGTTLIVTWSDVAVRTAHIDDAIVLVALTAGIRWCAAGRSQPAVLALAVAAAAKPWAIMFAPLALVADGGTGFGRERRGRGLAGWGSLALPVGRVALVGGLALLTWLPFIVAEPKTLDTSDFTITNDPTSVLRALGVADAATPSWARPVQLLGGLTVVALLVVLRRWPAALMAGVAWRLLWEPGANRYYTVGLVIGALLVELLGRRGRLPWMTVLAAIVLELTAVPGFAAVPGRTLRLVCVVAILVAAFRVPLADRLRAGRAETGFGPRPGEYRLDGGAA